MNANNWVYFSFQEQIRPLPSKQDPKETMKWKTDENSVGQTGFCLHLLKSFWLSDLSQPPSKQANKC